jgi:hypothetical protein
MSSRILDVADLAARRIVAFASGWKWGLIEEREVTRQKPDPGMTARA